MTSLLEELSKRRERECRLTPDRALRSLDEAHAFLRDRGMLTRTTGSSLPSLYEATHEDPYGTGRRDVGTSPTTKWEWAAELAERPDVHALKIQRSKTILFTDETLALADPICRGELTRMENEDPGWNRLLTHLARTGPSDVADVRHALGLKAQEIKALRYPLERCGALVSLPSEHGTLLARWDQAFPKAAAPERAPVVPVATPSRPAAALADLQTVPAGSVAAPPARDDGLSAFAALLTAAIRAAVLAPERELTRWFSWPCLFPDDLVDRLTEQGTLYRPAPGWVAASDLATPPHQHRPPRQPHPRRTTSAPPLPPAPHRLIAERNAPRPVISVVIGRSRWRRLFLREPVIIRDARFVRRTGGPMRRCAGAPAGRIGVPWHADGA